MISIFSADHALHDPPYELLDGALVPIYESPARAALIHAAIEQAALGPILPPRTFGLAHVASQETRIGLAHPSQCFAADEVDHVFRFKTGVGLPPSENWNI